jgi:hypothetical protein
VTFWGFWNVTERLIDVERDTEVLEHWQISYWVPLYYVRGWTLSDPRWPDDFPRDPTDASVAEWIKANPRAHVTKTTRQVIHAGQRPPGEGGPINGR